MNGSTKRDLESIVFYAQEILESFDKIKDEDCVKDLADQIENAACILSDIEGVLKDDDFLAEFGG